ncbi:MAG: cbb3-type cytochrome c oxidase subunit I, partial [Syntrophales bacterium]
MTQRNEPAAATSFYGRTGEYKWLIAEWMMSTDHKRIGVMYLMAILSFFSVGVVLGFMIRLSLLSPGWLMSQQTYNEFFTLHGVIQIFLFIIPGIPVAFGNIFLPILIGAQDVAFPRI